MVPSGTPPKFSWEEEGLALRNPGMQLEGLRYPVTPIGMHYFLIYFDIPHVDPATYELPVTGRGRNPLKLTLEDIRARSTVTMPVMMVERGRAAPVARPVAPGNWGVGGDDGRQEVSERSRVSA